MKETDAMTPEVSNGLSHEVTELDNPVLAKAADSQHDATVSNAPIPTQSTALEAPSDSEDEWATVEFPEAVIPVDHIPEGESIDIVTSLEQQNQTLRDRVVYLEKTLETAQTNLCQEVARWETLALAGDEKLQAQALAQEAAIAKYVAELTATQKKVGELFAQLELSHQTSQRQQIVMETLNGQYRNSQERVAQLERECADIHQKNVDQAQQILQQRHQLKDVQARLQRQQQYTLQYKAALEKSLAVAQTQTPTAPVLLSEASAQSLTVKQGTMPKPSPVQPWSAPATDDITESHKAWLNSFMHESETLPADTVITNFDWQPDTTQTGQQSVSFDLDELPLNDGNSFDDAASATSTGRLDTWETATASPFITLQTPSSESPTEDTPEAATPKHETLAAVDLPMFPKEENAEPSTLRS